MLKSVCEAIDGAIGSGSPTMSLFASVALVLGVLSVVVPLWLLVMVGWFKLLAWLFY